MVVWREKLVDDDTNQIYSQFLLKNMVLPSYIENIKAQPRRVATMRGWLYYGNNHLVGKNIRMKI